jgi:hypothetical protein
MGCSLRAVVTKALTHERIRNKIAAVVGPYQVAVGVKAGISISVFGATIHLGDDPEAATVKMDIENAFGCIERSAIVDSLKEMIDPELRALARIACVLLSPASPIIIGPAGARVFAPCNSVRGVQQGSNEGMPFFAIALHSKAFVKLIPLLPNPRALVLSSIADDINLSGKAEDAFAAFPILIDLLHSELNLTVQPSKSAYATHPNAAAAAVALIPPVPLGQRAQSPGSTAPPALGIVHGGVPIGDDNFIRETLNAVWLRAEADARKIHITLRDYPQHRHQMLTLSTQSTTDYWLQHVHPDLTRELSQRMDALITELSNDIAGIDIDAVPLGPERKRLPLRMGGLGLRAREPLRDAAYAGMVAKVIPRLAPSLNTAGETSMGYYATPHIVRVVGPGSFDSGDHNMGPFLASGCSVATGADAAWSRLQARVAPIGSLTPASGPLAQPFSSMGAGIQKLQHAITAQTEESDHKRLTDTIAAMPRPRMREAIVYTSIDEFSRAFLTVMPGAKLTSMGPAEFRECYARYIAGASPACAPFVGQTLNVSARGGLLDAYGDNAVAAAWTGSQESVFRHNPPVHALTGAIKDVGGYAIAEDSTFFASTLPAAAIAAAQARAAQGGHAHRLRVITPDFIARVDPAMGRLQLFEVKTIAYCRSWYTDNNSALPPGVARRAAPLAAEYTRKARAQDRSFGLAQPGPNANGPNATIGPIETMLNTVKPIRGIVFGAFGEVSADTRALVKDIAAQGGRKMHALMGVDPLQAAALIRTQLIGTIGTIAVRGHAQLLLARLSSLAPIAAQRGYTTHINQQIISLSALARAHYRSSIGTRTGAQVSAAN